MIARFTLALAISALAPGCSTSIAADDYDRSCETADDCVEVAEGERCNIDLCGCAGTAINVAEAERYNRDFEATVCLDPLNDLNPVCVCRGGMTVCTNGTCGVAPAP